MRKKLFTFLLALVTSVGMSWAWTSGDCTVTLDAGVVTVSGSGAMENYTYFTKTPWYYSRNSITSIIIEDGVTNVGDYAFMRLDNLQSVVIGNDVVTIGSHAFEQCGTSFTSLTLGNSIVEIGVNAFINNSGLTTVTFPSTLQTIGEDAFYGCTKISSLTIPSSVTSIGDYAFGGCSLIAYIIAEPTTPPSTEESTFISIVAPSYIPLYVPNGSVADYTAAERWNTFNIQGYDPSIGPTIEPVPATPDQLSGAFTINGDGDQINFSKGNLQYVGSWQFAENQWNIIGNDQADDNRDLFGWGTGDAPNKVSTTLADYADYHEWGTNMGDGWYTLSRDEWTYLFQNRTNAANLYAPAKVNGVNGFVILPDEFTLPSGLSFTAGVTNYGTNFYANAAWRAMENAGAVFLPVDGYRYDGNKIKWVGQSGFYWSSTVASEGASAWSWLISASDGARRDYYNLHYGMCVRLVKAASSTPAPTPANVCGDGLTWELSEGVLTISYDGEGTGEMYDFGYEYDENPVNVAPWKENKSAITTVVIGDGVKSIGNYAFNDLGENFTAVTIANSVERIGLSAFMNAKWVTEITLPSSLKTIDRECFAANFGFTSITIPSGVTSIGYHAFGYCTGLTSLTCEATTPPTLASGVFYKIRSTTSSISSIPLYVPSGSVAAYEAAAQWNAFDIQGYDPAPTPTPTVWTSLSVGDVIKVGDQLSPSVELASANDYGVFNPDWAPYTLLRANIAQDEYDEPVVTEAEDGAYYVFKFTHPSAGTYYFLAHPAKCTLLAATATSDGLEVTNVGDYYGTPLFTFAVHEPAAPTPTDEQVPTNADPENPSYHYSTFFHSTQNYALTNDGTQAFIATLGGNDLVLTKIAEGTQVIPANTAVIFRKSGSADPVVLTPTEENGVSVNPNDNSLKGVDAETAITSIDGLTATNCYVLSGTNEYGVGFYRINSDNLKAHKAYVKYAGLQTNAPRRMRFVFSEEQTATGMENVQNEETKAQKVMIDGVMYIIRGEHMYDAQGQIVK